MPQPLTLENHQIVLKKFDFRLLPVKKIMTKKPVFINKDELAAKALSIMNNKKITSLIVSKKDQPQKI